MKHIISLIFIHLLICPLWAQYSFTFQQEYFFGNLPSARVEAMGRANVAVGGEAASQFFNPAGIGLIQDQEVAFSTSAPFYALRESDYYFGSYVRRFKPNLVAALSFNQLAIGPTTFSTTINGTRYDVEKPSTTNLALTVAAEPIEGLQVGLNANFFNLNFFEDVSANRAAHFDVGALYQLPLAADSGSYQRFQFGASVNNITSSSITLTSPAGDEAIQDLPVILRIGTAYLIGTAVNIPGAGETPLDLTFTAELQNTLNSDFRSMFSLGAEGLVAKVFALRLGYLSQTLDDGGFTDNRDVIKDFTYGFGFRVPLHALTNNKFPFALHLDYVSLKQPPYTFRGRRLPNMRTYGFRLVWTPSTPNN